MLSFIYFIITKQFKYKKIIMNYQDIMLIKKIMDLFNFINMFHHKKFDLIYLYLFKNYFMIRRYSKIID